MYYLPILSNYLWNLLVFSEWTLWSIGKCEMRNAWIYTEHKSVKCWFEPVYWIWTESSKRTNSEKWIRDLISNRRGDGILTCKLGWYVSRPLSHSVTYFFFHSLLSDFPLLFNKIPCSRQKQSVMRRFQIRKDPKHWIITSWVILITLKHFQDWYEEGSKVETQS